jgi:hypothetical protein
MKYQTLYSFEVLKTIEDGQKVYMLDRKYVVNANVSNLTVEELVEIIKQEKEESTRFQFWTEIAETEENEDA